MGNDRSALTPMSVKDATKSSSNFGRADLVSTLLARLHENVTHAIILNFNGYPPQSKDKQILREIDKERWLNFPRKCPFYQPLIAALAKISRDWLENSINLLLEWMPPTQTLTKNKEEKKEEPPDLVTSAGQFAFETFFQNLTKHINEPEMRRMDIVGTVVELVIADVLAHMLINFQGGLSEWTLHRLENLAFIFFKPSNPKYLPVDIWKLLRYEISEQWAFILSEISPSCFGLITTHLGSVIAKAQKDPDEVVSYFRGVRWLRASLSSEGKNLDSFLELMILFIDSRESWSKKTRNLQLEILDHVLQSLDLSVLCPPNIAAKIQDIYKRGSRLYKTDEIEGPVLKLMTTCLVHGPNEFFEENIEEFLQKPLFKRILKGKKKEPLECLLKVVKGKYRTVYPKGWQPLQPIDFDRKDLIITQSPYSKSTLKLLENKEKILTRLQSISQTLFSRKPPFPKLVESADIFVEIMVQLAAHNIILVRDCINQNLFADKTSPVNLMIGLRILRNILDPSTGFWENAASTQKTSSFYVPKDEIEKLFSSNMIKILQYCEEQMGINVSLHSKDKFRHQFPPTIPTTYFDIETYPFKEFEFIKKNHETDRYNKKVKNAVKRWHDIVSRTLDSREREMNERHKFAERETCEILTAWYASINFPYNQSSELDPSKLMSWRKKTSQRNFTENRQSWSELYKEAIKCIHLVPEILQLDSTQFIGKLVLHDDEEIATTCSHALQKIMVENPSVRPKIIQGFLSLSIMYDHTAPGSLYTLLSQLLSLLDLWIERSYLFEKTEPQFPNSMVTETESIAFINLCNPDPKIRSTCLELLDAINALTPIHTNNKGLSSVLENREKSIVQKARYRLLLEVASGIDIDVRLDHQTSALISILKIASSNQAGLWTYVLSEIGRACVEEGCVHLLVLVRNMIHNYLSASLPLLPQDVPSESSLFIKDAWVNHQALLFSIAGIQSHYATRKASDSGRDTIKKSFDIESIDGDSVEEQLNLERLLQYKLLNYLNEIWNGLLSEVDWVRNGIILACSLAHWRSWPLILTNLQKWYEDLSASRNAKKKKVRTEIARILRSISQGKELCRVLREHQEISQIFMNFIAELDVHFGSSRTLTATSNEPYYIDNALIIKNFSSGLSDVPPYAYKGPIRVYLGRKIENLELSKERDKILNVLLQWSGYGKFATIRTTTESKMLAKTTRDPKKEEKKRDFEKILRDVRVCSRLAVEGYCKLGPLFPDELTPDHLEWIIDAENKGFRILKWILAFNFEKLFPLFINKSYSGNESVLFIHALYDQFLPSVSIHSPPTTGITDDIIEYCQRVDNDKKESEHIVQSPLTMSDDIFGKSVKEIAGIIIHLALTCLVHPAPLVRSRSFDLIARLAPVSFGAVREVQENDQRSERRKNFEELKNSFNSRIIATARQSALQVSSLTSQVCSMFAEQLFKEAFLRLRNMNFAIKKWIIQFIIPWADHIVLSEGVVMKEFAQGTFLEAAFSLSMDLVQTDFPQELGILWQRLSKGRDENLPVIVNFLFKKAITAKSFASLCKTIILFIYRNDPYSTLSPIIRCLSFAGVASSFDEIASRDSKSIEQSEKSESPNIPITNNNNSISKRDRKTLLKKSSKDITSPPTNIQEPPVPTTENDSDNENENPMIDKDKEVRREIKEKIKESYQLREFVVSILTDLTTEYFTPLLNHMHILVNYSLLRMDSSESKGLISLLTVLLEGLKKEIDSVAELELLEGKDFSLKVALDLDTILRTLKTGLFKVNWHENPDTTKSSTDWVTKSGYISEIVSILLQCFSKTNPDAIEKWGKEAFEWATGNKDIYLSIKALRIYRAILSPLNGDLINQLLYQLVESIERMEDCLLVTLKMSRQNKLSARRIAIEEGRSALNRSKAVEILYTFHNIVPKIISDYSQLTSLFWTAAGFMGSTQPAFFQLYQAAEKLLKSLVQNNFFASTDTLKQNIEKQFVVLTKENLFKGIQPLLFQGMLMPKTEEISIQLLLAFAKIDYESLVLQPPTARQSLTLLGILVWLRNVFSTSSRRVSSINQLIPEVCNDLASVLEKSESSYKKTVQLLKSIKNVNDIEITKFTQIICQELSAQPQNATIFADLLGSMLIYGHGPSIQSYANSILYVTNNLLRYAPIEEAIRLKLIIDFKPILRIASYKVGGATVDRSINLFDNVALNLKSNGNADPLRQPLSNFNIRHISTFMRKLVTPSGANLAEIPQSPRELKKFFRRSLKATTLRKTKSFISQQQQEATQPSAPQKESSQPPESGPRERFKYQAPEKFGRFPTFRGFMEEILNFDVSPAPETHRPIAVEKDQDSKSMDYSHDSSNENESFIKTEEEYYDSDGTFKIVETSSEEEYDSDFSQEEESDSKKEEKKERRKNSSVGNIYDEELSDLHVTNLRQILEDKSQRSFFGDFVEKSNFVRNEFYFSDSVIRFKQDGDPAHAKSIIDQFISDSAFTPIEISEQTRNYLLNSYEANPSSISPNLFDDALNEALKKIEKDIFPGFLNSEQYSAMKGSERKI